MTDTNGTAMLAGRRVVIVGGTSGMGRGAARAACDAGAEVIVVGRRPPSERVNAGSVRHESVDMTDPASVQALLERIGELDHLLVSATPSTGSTGKFLEQDLERARAFMDGKFFGSWVCARHAAPRLRAGGSITFVTGGAAVRPKAGITIVSAAFRALETLAQGLAIELGPIRVNAIRPGYTDSEMWAFLDETARDELRRKVAALMPVRRMGTVEDVGHAAVFLMTNPQVTGAVLEITGGETLVDAI
jgi:NAD(P)-dependent dehydrogenase (short-subunit alcohol dehydrogenase family)